MRSASGQRVGFAMEERPDLLQRDSEELEGHDLLQPLQIAKAIQAIASLRAPGLQ